MKKKVEETDIEVKLIKYRILTIAFLIVLIILMMSAVKTENEILLISSSVAIGILFLLNLRYVIINKKKVDSIRVYEKEVRCTDLHPLELYMLDRIWYHKKKKFSREQLYAAVLYEIEEGNLLLTDKGIKISPKIDLEQLSPYSSVTLEMSLLERIDCRKIKRLKLNKLKSIQEEQIAIVIDDINSNIKENCLDKELFYELMTDMKNNYFEEIETKTTVYLTISSWICAIATIPFVFAFQEKATILNFYLPIGLAVLLVATITSKYRERVTIKEGNKSFVFDTLNYIKYLSNPEKNKTNEIYAYCLEKNTDTKIVSIFNK